MDVTGFGHVPYSLLQNKHELKVSVEASLAPDKFQSLLMKISAQYYQFIFQPCSLKDKLRTFRITLTATCRTHQNIQAYIRITTITIEVMHAILHEQLNVEAIPDMII